MRTTSLEKLVDLQQNPKNIRNICVLAHVDHGKTTLCDALVASNGIISQRMAGKLRYMDSREDEQERGITMKSSAISLFFECGEEESLINLIDTPGHVDFSSEVSTAVRLCDGAIIVVDVVEGVCPQTHAVLRQAWLEKIKPVLVLNKIDRLITELKMEPLEAHIHLQQTLEQVNLVTSELFTSEVMQKTANVSSSVVDPMFQISLMWVCSKPASHDWTEDADDLKNIFFSPDQGNVVFASAYDSWGFTIDHFAKLVSEKMGMNEDVLRKTLWGDYYLNTKTKRIIKGAQAKAKKPLFVQFVLENIWRVYESVYLKRDKEMAEKIVRSLNLKISVRDMRHTDARVHLQAITSQWMPISRAVLSMVSRRLPAPLDISEDRIENLMCSISQTFDSLPTATQDLKKDFLKCSSNDDGHVVVFVSKMFPVDKKALSKNRQRPLGEREIQERRDQARLRHADRQVVSTPSEEAGQVQDDIVEMFGPASAKEEDDLDHVFLAFARIFSGTVKKGQQLFVLGPKHDPGKALRDKAEGVTIDVNLTLKDLPSDKHILSFVVEDLYLMMGREMESVDEVPAGNVFGMSGLDEHILKSATLASTVSCPAFTDLYFDAAPIVRVAIEPKIAGNMSKLVCGLKLLNQADPCVQVLIQETGEHVIITAGEIHLKRCIDDLTDRYAKIEIKASDPIVPFRETIIPPPKIDMVNEAIQDLNQPVKSLRLKDFEDDDEVLDAGLVQMCTSNKNCQIIIHAISLPETITSLLEENQQLLKTLHDKTFVENSLIESTVELNKVALENLKDFKKKLQNAFKVSGKRWRNAADRIWAFGPKHIGPNLLLNGIEDYDRPNVWYVIEKETQSQLPIREFDSSIVNGFQFASLAGPLCEEPMCGLCFIVKKWHYKVTPTRLVSLDSSDSECISPKESFLAEDGAFSEIIKGHNQHHCNRIEISSVRNENSTNSENPQDSFSCCNGIQTEHSESVIDHRPATNGEESSVQSETNGKDDYKMKKFETYGPFSGQLMSCMKDGCRKAFQTQPQRLMAAMYRCNIQATADVLGKLYGVLNKRNGRAISDEMREGTQVFNIHAVLPVVESFGFAEEIRKKTSGLASPQLVFSHWEVVDVDPFWVPTTEEEYLHFGVKADSHNRARQYMNSVRKRKGLKVDEKIVEHAEKQRTLTKMK
ncbi:hypothetical protein ScPMuIL_018837 [Solemya velum]